MFQALFDKFIKFFFIFKFQFSRFLFLNNLIELIKDHSLYIWHILCGFVQIRLYNVAVVWIYGKPVFTVNLNVKFTLSQEAFHCMILISFIQTNHFKISNLWMAVFDNLILPLIYRLIHFHSKNYIFTLTSRNGNLIFIGNLQATPDLSWCWVKSARIEIESCFCQKHIYFFNIFCEI